MPAPAMAVVALDELVIQGWDRAVATDQPYAPDEPSVQACLGCRCPTTLLRSTGCSA